MKKYETHIAEIIDGVECADTPLDENRLYGGPLLEEVVKLAAMTMGFYTAQKAHTSYRPPYEKMRTKADLQQLMEFACKDMAKPYVVAFCREALEKTDSEEQLAIRAIKLYVMHYDHLSRSTSWGLPTIDAVLATVQQAAGIGRAAANGNGSVPKDPEPS